MPLHYVIACWHCHTGCRCCVSVGRTGSTGKLIGLLTHNCSIEYVDDITAQLRLLLHSSALPPQERLSVLVTAVDIVKHQVRAEHVHNALTVRGEFHGCRQQHPQAPRWATLAPRDGCRRAAL